MEYPFIFLAMAVSFAIHPFLILFLTLFVPSIIVSAASKPHQNRYGVQLIHRDSPLSPFHNPKSTLDDRANWALKSSISRYAYLSMKQNSMAYGSHMDAFKPIVETDGFEYLARLSIGTPPVDIYTVIDTASELLWTQCEPCGQCYPQSVPIFDPKKSSSYTNVSCVSPFCKFLRYKDCKPTCVYHYSSIDGSESTGFVGNDVLTFKALDGSITTLPNVSFGCGTYNKKSVQLGYQTGVLGLESSETSLMYHPSLSPTFSYCVGNLSDQFSVGTLILGEGAFISGASTPFIQKGLYYVKLLGISVASQKLYIPPGTFDLKESGKGGVYLDSGSKFTFLAPEGYNRLSQALSNMIERYLGGPVPDPQGGGKLCFTGSISRDLVGFPDVTFHFDGDADLVLEKWSIFLQVNEDVFCLAFLSGGADGSSVIGNMAQQFYNFGFDLINKVVSFKSIDCSLV